MQSMLSLLPPLLVWTCLLKLTSISADQQSTESTQYNMVSNTSPQSQKLIQASLGLARQLSQSPGLYCRIEVKLGENPFNFQTDGSPGKFPGTFPGKFPGEFPGKRKSPSDYRRDPRRRNHLGKGTPPTPGNNGVGSVVPGFPTGARNGIYFPPSLILSSMQ